MNGSGGIIAGQIHRVQGLSSCGQVQQMGQHSGTVVAVNAVAVVQRTGRCGGACTDQPLQMVPARAINTAETHYRGGYRTLECLLFTGQQNTAVLTVRFGNGLFIHPLMSRLGINTAAAGQEQMPRGVGQCRQQMAQTLHIDAVIGFRVRVPGRCGIEQPVTPGQLFQSARVGYIGRNAMDAGGQLVYSTTKSEHLCSLRTQLDTQPGAHISAAGNQHSLFLERCFVSQPTLSIAVKKLEEELGVALFERSKNAVRVTPVGEKVVRQAQIVLEQAEAVRELAREGRDQLASPLRIGAIYTIGPYLFPQLIPQIQQLAPNMPLYIEENFTENLRVKIRNGELDAIIIALPFHESDVLTRPLYDEPFMMVVPKGHELARQKEIDSRQLNEIRMLLLGEGHCFRDQVLEACPTLNQSFHDQHTVTEGSSLETIRMMVASGLGTSVLPLSAIENHPATDLIEVRPFKQPSPMRTVAVAWRTSFPRPQAIDVLVQAINRCNINVTGEKRQA